MAQIVAVHISGSLRPVPALGRLSKGDRVTVRYPSGDVDCEIIGFDGPTVEVRAV